jgi:RNA polymerase sigma-70 factor (ECF subfamily)
MVRAWRRADALETRAALRAWLYRIATNVCLDMLRGAQRRARPMDLASPVSADSVLGAELPEHTWLQPVPDGRVLPGDGDPAELAALRETLRLAFVAALQHLPPRQRAVLILREVLRWQASEVAELLETTVASVNSALQRARATLDALDLDSSRPDPQPADGAHQRLLARYMDAFERYDMPALVSLLHEDATFTMPPFALWLQGPDQVTAWMLGQGHGCRGSRLLATSANGCPAFAVYRRSGPDRHEPFAITMLEITGDRVSAVNNFVGTALFSHFGLPPRLEGYDVTSRRRPVSTS